MANQQSQLFFPASTCGPGGGGLRSPSAWSSARRRSCRCPGWRCLRWSSARWCCRPCSPGSWVTRYEFTFAARNPSSDLEHAPSRTLFYSSCRLWRSSRSARRTSQISRRDRRQRFEELALRRTLTAGHSRHPSGPQESGTSASARRTLRPSLFSRTAALQPGVKGQTRAGAPLHASFSTNLFSVAPLWAVCEATGTDLRRTAWTSSSPARPWNRTYTSVFAFVAYPRWFLPTARL